MADTYSFVVLRIQLIFFLTLQMFLKIRIFEIVNFIFTKHQNLNCSLYRDSKMTEDAEVRI